MNISTCPHCHAAVATELSIDNSPIRFCPSCAAELPIDQQSLEEHLFRKALERNESQRAAYLDNHCDGDELLRQRIDQLLANHKSTGGLLDPFCESPTGTDEYFGHTEGETIGNYKLLQKIGEGGFGVVFMSDQLRPVKRRVALKLIKPGMDSKAVVARFEAERQALAIMDHPHIASVYDGGATKEGRPYFVMELVKGVPITTYCDDNKLSINDRLQLFIDVCQAIQHAHQKGVIHRDIKPSNVMITLHDGKPVVKVIDFGVAKAMHTDLTEKTLFTAYGQMIGTPQYMSPEQAEVSGLDVDTRSDIFSLGVLLYELLTGTTPLESKELKSAGFAELQRLIKLKEPQRPSLRLSSAGEKLTHLANQRNIDARSLPRALRGDLDWIVLKALAKERERRYESATAFSDDIRRFMSNEAVSARPPSSSYLFRKWVERHRSVAMLTGVIIISAIVGILALSYNNFVKQQHIRELAQHQNDLEVASRLAEEESKLRIRDLYYSDINLAYRLVDENNYRSALDILQRYNNSSTGIYRGFEWHYLWKSLEPRRKADEFKFDSVPETVRFLHDGTICVGDWSGQVTRIDIDTRQRTTLIDPALGRSIREGDGTAHGLIMGSAQSTARVIGHWLPDQNSVRLTSIGPKRSEFEIPAQVPTHFTFSSDGKHVVVLRCFGPSQIIDLETGNVVHSLSAVSPTTHNKPERIVSKEHLAISSDGNLLGAIVEDKVQVWSVDSDTLLWEKQFTGSPNVIEFSPNSKQLALGTENGAVRLLIFDAATGGNPIAQRSDHTDAVRCLAYSPDGSMLVSGSRDNSIRIWNANNLGRLATLKGHAGIVNDVAFSPDGKKIASVAQDYHTVVWSVPDIIEYRGLDQENRASVWIVENELVMFPGKEGKLTFSKLNPNGLSRLQHLSGRKASAIDATPSGTFAIASNKLIEIHRDGSPIQSLHASADDPITCIRLGNRESLLAMGTRSGKVEVIDLNSGVRQKGTIRHPQSVKALAFDSTDTYLASGGGTWGDQGDADIFVWDVSKPQLERVAILSKHLDQVTSLVFSPDGNSLVSASIDNNIHVWKWRQPNREPAMSLTGHTASVRRVIFSPDGKRVLSCAGDRTVRFWDWETGVQCGQIQVLGDLKGISSIDWLNRHTLLGIDHYGGVHVWEGQNF